MASNASSFTECLVSNSVKKRDANDNGFHSSISCWSNARSPVCWRRKVFAKSGMDLLSWFTAPKYELSSFRFDGFSRFEIPWILLFIGSTPCCDNLYPTHSRSAAKLYLSSNYCLLRPVFVILPWPFQCVLPQFHALLRDCRLWRKMYLIQLQALCPWFFGIRLASLSLRRSLLQLGIPSLPICRLFGSYSVRMCSRWVHLVRSHVSHQMLKKCPARPSANVFSYHEFKVIKVWQWVFIFFWLTVHTG